MDKKQLIVALAVLMCVFLNGCALLSLPFEVAGGTLSVLGKIVKGAIDLAKKLPTPPPGVF